MPTGVAKDTRPWQETRASRPLPILLTSGSVLVLAKRARQAFHGVPSVLVPPKLQLRGRSYRKGRGWDPKSLGKEQFFLHLLNGGLPLGSIWFHQF